MNSRMLSSVSKCQNCEQECNKRGRAAKEERQWRMEASQELREEEEEQ